jgi:hypothetical protein
MEDYSKEVENAEKEYNSANDKLKKLIDKSLKEMLGGIELEFDSDEGCEWNGVRYVDDNDMLGTANVTKVRLQNGNVEIYLEDNDLWTEYKSIEGCEIVDEEDWFMRLHALVKEAYENRATTADA